MNFPVLTFASHHACLWILSWSRLRRPSSKARTCHYKLFLPLSWKNWLKHGRTYHSGSKTQQGVRIETVSIRALSPAYSDGNLAGFANFPPLGLVLLRFLLEKIVFPQLEERIPGLEYACWKGWIIKPTPLLSTLRPLEGVSPQSTGEESGDESEVAGSSYTYVLDERYPLRGEIVPGGVGVDFEGTMIALNMKGGEVVIHDSKTGATLPGSKRMYSKAAPFIR